MAEYQQDNRRCSLAQTLKEAGFIRLPPLYVKSTDMPEIHRIAHRYGDQVNALRAQHREEQERLSDDSREKAWEAFDMLRNS